MVGAQGFTWPVSQAPCGEARIDELLSSPIDRHFAALAGGEVVEKV